MRLIEFFIRRPLMVNLLTAFILFAGLVSIGLLSREAFPPIDMDLVTVRTTYPNATPQEVEKLITIPLEEELFEVDGIKEMTSISEENISNLLLEIDPNVRDKNKVVNEIQRAVDRVSDLPEEADDPIVDDVNTGEIPVIQVSLTGELDENSLRHYAESLEDKLIDHPGIASIGKSGWRDPEIWVEVDPQKSQSYYLALSEVAESLAKRNLNLPGGTMQRDGKEFLLRTLGEFETPDEIRKVVVRANDLGNWIRIEDIATVKETYEEESIIYRTNGKRSINLIVIKRESADIIRVVDDVKKICSDFQKVIPAGIQISFIDDLSYFVRRRLHILINNAIIGIILVLACLNLFLHWRVALLVALGLPVAYMGTLFVMNAAHISINLLSMFGLITVVGMLVDDAIIIAENCFRHLEEGVSPREAALKGTHEVILPVTITVLTTVFAFVPLLLMSGIMGKYVRHIPIVVIVALLVSLIEALIILPSHIAEIVRSVPKKKAESRWYGFLVLEYRKILSFLFDHRKVAFLLFIVIAAFCLVFGLQHSRKILFPSEGIETFFIELESPIGTPKEEMERLSQRVESIVATLPSSELDNFVTSIGVTQQEPNDPATKRASHLSQITVYLTPSQSRLRSEKAIVDDLRAKTNALNGLKIKFQNVRPGPPIGRAIAVRIKGNTYDTILEQAGQFKKWLGSMRGVTDIEDDFSPGKNEIRVLVDEERATQAFLTVTDIARAVNAAYAGQIATTIKTTSDEIEVRVKFPEREKFNLASIQEILIKNARGNLIPFQKVARIEEQAGISGIRHLDKKRVVGVYANVDEKQTTSQAVNQQLMKLYAQQPKLSLENTVIFGGEQEDTSESFESLKRAFLLAIFLIFLCLASMFQSLLHPLIVLLAIPFGFLGVLVTFLLHQQPLSFMCFMGTVGLTGIVVNDAIVLIDFINKHRWEGASLKEAIVNAASLRLRPVILTTITTTAGLLPTAYGWGGADPFIKPMALAIAWGLFFATITTLLIIPLAYGVAEDARRIFFKENPLKRIP